MHSRPAEVASGQADSDRAALIYQRATRDADGKIADALDTRIKAERINDDGGATGAVVPVG